MIDIFDYLDYRDFLKDWIVSLPGRGRGVPTQLAKAIGTSSSFVSQVLNTSVDLSLEQAHAAAIFFKWPPNVSRYFLLLVQKARAGTRPLREFFTNEILADQKAHFDLRRVIPTENVLTEMDRAQYYSDWKFSAVHVLCTIPEFQSRSALIRRLRGAPDDVERVINFLVSRGVLRETKDGLKPGQVRVHLEKDSPWIRKHHLNWRVEAVKSLESEEFKEDLHYSSIVSLSKADFARVQKIFMRAVESAIEVVKPSPEEQGCAILLDVFKV